MRFQLGLGAILSALLLAALPVSAAATTSDPPPPAAAPPGPAEQADPGGQADQDTRADQEMQADRGARAGRDDGPRRAARAEAVLDRARALFRERPRPAARDARSARRTVADAESTEPVHATPVLRDLALAMDDLEADDRRVARRILARPTDGAKDPAGTGYPAGTRTDHRCSAAAPLCVHWVVDEGSEHAPDLTDADEDAVPDWVEENLFVFEEVWQRLVPGLGYRTPVRDDALENHGPDGSTDVYLAELGQFGMFGYCTSDRLADRAVYCVVDDDFAELSARPPAESLRVTAAHELFHAVQFAYRLDADYWVLEGTAAWVEDEVYDWIDDNLRYLRRSPLRVPASSLDYLHPTSYEWDYGSWIWWRFLTERFAVTGSPDPTVVREVWERLATDGPRETTHRAVRTVIRARGTTFDRAFAQFGAVNRMAPRWYEEGRSYARFVGAPTWRLGLTRARTGTGWRETRLSHLSSRHAVLRPGTGLAGPWRLRVSLDLPRRTRGGAASVAVQRRDGRVTLREVRLDLRGNARFSVPFDRRQVTRVTLTLTSTSTRVRACGSGTIWTCSGIPLDDDLRYAFRADAVRRG